MIAATGRRLSAEEQIVECRECGERNRDEARFCAVVRVALSLACASCGSELRAGARFCDSCGAAVARDAPARASCARR